PNPKHTYNKAGVYHVCLHEDNGCYKSSLCRNLNVSDSRLSEQNLGSNLESSIQAYPNPCFSCTKIQISISNNSNVELNLLDLEGKALKTISLGNLDSGSYEFRLDLKNIKEGIYLLTMKTSDGTLTEKLVVQ